jgi:hypothetical protein
MADQLATPEDLASALERDDVDESKAILLVECATAVVQEAAGQRIVQVVDDPFEIMGTSDSWLALPQIPVTAASAITIDGAATTHWKKFGDRLWRSHGWQRNLGCSWSSCNGVHDHGCGPEPSAIGGIYTHGYAPGAQELQLGRGAVLSICTAAYGNPAGVKAEKIDDYAVTYAVLSGQMDASPYLAAALRKKYGRRGGLVRIG